MSCFVVPICWSFRLCLDRASLSRNSSSSSSSSSSSPCRSVLNVEGLGSDGASGSLPLYQLGEDVRALLAGPAYERACERALVGDDPVYEEAAGGSPHHVYETASMYSRESPVYGGAQMPKNPVYETASINSVDDPVYEMADGTNQANADYDNPVPKGRAAGDYEFASSNRPSDTYDKMGVVAEEPVYDNNEYPAGPE